tara:strand:- start:1900 stop:2433 length:534 start_codon:yes stop_codon:yes gene_type:complete
MATMILLPDGTGTSSDDWETSSGTRHDCLDDDNGDTSFVSCDDDGETMIIQFANPSVAEADIDFNEEVSVRFLSSGRSTNRRNASEVVIAYHVPSTSAFDQTLSYDAHAFTYESLPGIARSTSDGSSADWTYSDLEDLQMKCTKNGTEEVRLSYLALRVDYTEAVAADNATFFGANF